VPSSGTARPRRAVARRSIRWVIFFWFGSGFFEVAGNDGLWLGGLRSWLAAWPGGGGRWRRLRADANGVRLPPPAGLGAGGGGNGTRSSRDRVLERVDLPLSRSIFLFEKNGSALFPDAWAAEAEGAHGCGVAPGPRVQPSMQARGRPRTPRLGSRTARAPRHRNVARGGTRWIPTTARRSARERDSEACGRARAAEGILPSPLYPPAARHGAVRRLALASFRDRAAWRCRGAVEAFGSARRRLPPRRAAPT